MGLTYTFIRANTEPLDNLWSALRPTREATFRDGAPWSALRLLFCHQAVQRAETDEAFGACVMDWLRDGIVQQCGNELQCPFHVRTAGGLYLFSDFLNDSEADAVMGAGETTAILHRAARPAERVGEVLDLGCGAGTLALLLASKCGHVIGTDINARAVKLARFNVVLNGITNAEFRVGSLYEPVADECFDLIVSQPPYYPQGDSPLRFLHGGPRGDEIPRAVVEGLAAHLNDSGKAFVFTSWPDDSVPYQHPELQSVQLATTRTELFETRQSLNVFDKVGDGWLEMLTVPGDVWGAVSGNRIAELYSGFRLLRLGDDVLRTARLRFPCEVEVVREGDELYLRYAAESLVGLIVMTEDSLAGLQALNAADSVAVPLLPLAKTALRNGWLKIH